MRGIDDEGACVSVRARHRHPPGRSARRGARGKRAASREDKNFKSLETDEERKTAIEAFWSARDTTPGTPRNEFKENFHSRLGYAMRNFSEGAAGWTSDEGRVYMIVGPYDDQVIHNWGHVWVYTRTFPSGKSKWAGKRVRVEIGFTRVDKNYRLIPEGMALLSAVKKMGPLEAAEFVMSR